MKNLFFIFYFISLCVSCKKEYICKCYSDRRGYIVEQFSDSYKERKKDAALTKCKNDYENSSDYVNGGYCEIK